MSRGVQETGVDGERTAHHPLDPFLVWLRPKIALRSQGELRAWYLRNENPFVGSRPATYTDPIQGIGVEMLRGIFMVFRPSPIAVDRLGARAYIASSSSAKQCAGEREESHLVHSHVQGTSKHVEALPSVRQCGKP